MKILHLLRDSLSLCKVRFGPEITNILINSEETAAYLAKKFGVPDILIRDLEERKQLVAMA
jgi:phage portal protein BeeE